MPLCNIFFVYFQPKKNPKQFYRKCEQRSMDCFHDIGKNDPEIQKSIIQQRLDNSIKLSGCVPLKRPAGSINHTTTVQVQQSPAYGDAGAWPLALTVDKEQLPTNNYLAHD